ncbi:unnamed protein product [Paramecium primaurelia]|uniref:Thioesterase domain-containing protein n=1 Tax=Paramecium primaurelia TaxID=5886 RepID=A0A8S1N4N8_PARPR|nr:unnamed protein product [Paramecium primaurelia]CAD8084005.1 unnamed protein product [Paramecium primaurelia]
MVHKEFGDIFKRFVQIPILKNTYAEHFYLAFQYLPGHALERNSNHLVLRYKVPQNIMNMNGSVHGGALATILDCATTIAILRGDKNLSRTVSIELGLSFISPAKLNDSLLIHAVCQKVGKNIAYSVCDIYEEHDMKLVTTGRHIKAVLSGTFFDSDFKKIS